MGFHCHLLSKTYQTLSGQVAALQDVTFGMARREFLCVVGPSGCGKTTLLRIVAGLMKPTSGQITFDQQSVGRQPRCALVFQEHGLFPWMKVVDNAAFGLEMQGIRQKERRERARAFIDKVGLAAFADSYPHELSVGMRQRVAIARAFVADPEILLMDEPFGSLDAQTRLVLQQELLRVWQDDRKMVLYVTHDIDEAVLLGDRVLVMSGRPGTILQDIPVPLDRPRDPLRHERPETTRIRRQIWETLRDEVLKSLHIAG